MSPAAQPASMVERRTAQQKLDDRRERSPLWRRGSEGSWERHCIGCGRWLPASEELWYLTARGWVAYGRCRRCHNAKTSADRRGRRKA